MNEIIFLEHQWQNISKQLFGQNEISLWQNIVFHYQQKDRFYHNLHHLYECFILFDEVKHLLNKPNLVALALFYHDIIYDSKNNDNELNSANFAKNQLKNKIPDDGLSIIYQYILATKNHQNYLTDKNFYDLNYLLDIDLAILAQNKKRFLEYNAQIRKEYKWVSSWIYYPKRHFILYHFYQKSPLFLTDYFYQKSEKQAKENLASVLFKPYHPSSRLFS